MSRKFGWFVGLGVAVAVVFGWASGAGAKVVLNEHPAIDVTVTSPCTGEVINLDGESHLVATETVDAQGVMHVATHMEFNLKGSLADGTPVDFVGFLNDVTNNADFTPGSAHEQTMVQQFQLVTRGSQDGGFTMIFYVHVTLSASGELSTSFDAQVICEGC